MRGRACTQQDKVCKGREPQPIEGNNDTSQYMHNGKHVHMTSKICDKDNNKADESVIIPLVKHVETNQSNEEPKTGENKQIHALQENSTTRQTNQSGKDQLLESESTQENSTLAQEIRQVVSIVKKPITEDGFEIVVSKSQQRKIKTKQKRINAILSQNDVASSS